MDDLGSYRVLVMMGTGLSTLAVRYRNHTLKTPFKGINSLTYQAGSPYYQRLTLIGIPCINYEKGLYRECST